MMAPPADDEGRSSWLPDDRIACQGPLDTGTNIFQQTCTKQTRQRQESRQKAWTGPARVWFNNHNVNLEALCPPCQTSAHKGVHSENYQQRIAADAHWFVADHPHRPHELMAAAAAQMVPHQAATMADHVMALEAKVMIDVEERNFQLWNRIQELEKRNLELTGVNIELSDRISEQRARIDKLEKDMEELEAPEEMKMESFTRHIGELEQQLEKKINEQWEKIDMLGNIVDGLEDEKLSQRITELEKKIDELEAEGNPSKRIADLEKQVKAIMALPQNAALGVVTAVRS